MLLEPQAEPRTTAARPAPDLAAAIRPADQTSRQRPAAASDAWPLFQQAWWLDAAATGAWDAIEVRRDGAVIGRLPFMRKRRLGLTILTQPPLTPYLGPWVAPGTGKYSACLAHEHAVLRELGAALPAHDIFVQNCHPSLTNCLALHWCGFAQATGYTYRFDDLANLEQIWADLAAKVRTEIRKAERQVEVQSCDDIEVLLRLNRMTFARQGLAPPYPDELVRRIDAACAARGVRQMFVAVGADGLPHAVDYVVWDEACTYGLISGSDPELRKSGASYLLRWQAIKFASQVSRSFDCSGSMLEQIEPGIRALGARQVRYARLTRGSTLPGRLALTLDSMRRHQPRGTS